MYRSRTFGDSPVTTYAIIERAIELSHCELIQPQTAWRSSYDRPVYPAELSTTYGEWDEIRNGSEINPRTVYAFVNYASGSDYSGNLVERSNYEALQDMMPGEYEDGEHYIRYHGGFGTFGIAIRLDSLTPELLEALESLDDYPLLDESLHSELEVQAQNDSWDGWAKSDFRSELSKRLVSEFEDCPRYEQQDGETDQQYAERIEAAKEWLEDGADITDEHLAELFYKLADYTNTDWINEQGSDCYIDIERVVAGLDKTPTQDWQKKAYAEIKALLRDAIGNRKYELGIVRFIDPNQLSLSFTGQEN